MKADDRYLDEVMMTLDLRGPLGREEEIGEEPDAS
jgi:hypothetical protein